jgi:perosamine synthetase
LSKKIPWWQPQMTGEELSQVKEVIEANYLNEGDVTERFERAIAKMVGVKHAIGTTSGTSALFLALKAAGVKPGDEVIVPDLTFIASANAAEMAGAKVVLVDIDPRTLTISIEATKHAITSKTKAIMPVHVSGRGADMDALMALANRYRIAVVEDAAEALMSTVRGKRLGAIGIAGCLSFSPNKTITTGQGGMVLTNDDAIHNRLKELKDQGRPVRGTGGDDVHHSVGYNFKLTNLQSAIGMAQLTQLETRLERQRKTWRIYAEKLKDIPGFRLPGFRVDDGEIPQWVDAVIERRDELDQFLQSKQIGCRRFWLPLHTQAPYKLTDTSFPNSTRIGPQCIWLPTAFTTTDEDVLTVCQAIREFYS